MPKGRHGGWASWSDRRRVVRSRTSYRLLVLSWRSLLLALAFGALIQVLSTNGMIGHATTLVLIVPCVLVFLVSWLVALVTLGIQAAHFSVGPLGRGPIQRQVRFSGMFVVDLVTLRLRPCRNRVRDDRSGDQGK